MWVALSTGSSFEPSTKWHDFLALAGEFPYASDFKRDGKDDIITFTHTSDADVYTAPSNGSSFGPGVLWHDFLGLPGETSL